jgi:hypothetical protein
MNFQDLLEHVCLDPRIHDGIFSLEKDSHLNILQEYLQQGGMSYEQTVLLRNCLLEGKYPERQAYNANGLLVTFPTPEYKQKAIARGTHFEENPKKAQQAAAVNIFDTKPEEKPEPQSTPPEEKPADQPATQPTTQSEPTSTDVNTDLTVNVDKKDEPDLRTSQEKQQDAQVVQKILTTEYSLEEAVSNNFYHKNGTWYTSEGEFVGKSRYIENLGKVMIIGKK